MTMRNDRIPGGVVAITKSDTTQLNLVGFYVGGTGDVSVKAADGSTATFSAVPVGTVIWGAFTQINSTSTTATLIVGLLP